MTNGDMTTGSETGQRTTNFYIRIPYSNGIKSTTNHIIKNTGFPFNLVTFADEMVEIEVYGDYKTYLDEVYSRKEKNNEAMKKYEKAHEDWKISHELHMFGVPQHMAKGRELEWLEKNPEPRPPVLVKEKIQEKAKQKNARVFFFTIEHFAYSKKEYDEIHEKIGKFVLDLSMFLLNKGRIKEGLLTYAITGKVLSYKIKGNSCVIDHRDIESIERMKKINDDLQAEIKQLKRKVEFASGSENTLQERLKMAEKTQERLEREGTDDLNKIRLIRRIIILGLNDADLEKAFSRVKESMEMNGSTKEQIDAEIEKMKEAIGRRSR